MANESEQAPTGRPTLYTVEIAIEICNRIELGELVRHICRESKYPTVNTINNWRRRYPEFFVSFLRAREMAAEAFVEMAFEEASDSSKDMYVSDKGATPNHAAVGRSKLKIESLHHMASNANPYRYYRFNTPDELSYRQGSGASLSTRADFIMQATENGYLDPDIAANLLTGISNVAKIRESDEVVDRIEELEKQLGKRTNTKTT